MRLNTAETEALSLVLDRTAFEIQLFAEFGEPTPREAAR